MGETPDNTAPLIQPVPDVSPTPASQRSPWSLLVVGLVAGATAVGIVALALREAKPAPRREVQRSEATTRERRDQLPATQSTTVPRAETAGRPNAPSAPIIPLAQAITKPEQLLALERTAIGRGDEATLTALLVPNAFGFGVDAKQVGYTAAEVAANIVKATAKARKTGKLRKSRYTKILGTDDVRWIVDDFDIGKQRFATSQLAVKIDGTWRIAAWHWARPVDNSAAAALAKAGKLPPLPTIRGDRDNAKLRAAVVRLFSARMHFVNGFSPRADAIDVGSAPDEYILGGEQVKQRFADVSFEILGPTRQERFAVGQVTKRVAWAAANVTLASGNSQNVRVLAVLVEDDAGEWRAVLAHWSNGA